MVQRFVLTTAFRTSYTGRTSDKPTGSDSEGRSSPSEGFDDSVNTSYAYTRAGALLVTFLPRQSPQRAPYLRGPRQRQRPDDVMHFVLLSCPSLVPEKNDPCLSLISRGYVRFFGCTVQNQTTSFNTAARNFHSSSFMFSDKKNGYNDTKSQQISQPARKPHDYVAFVHS